MIKFRKQFRHGEKGFTLVELLVVIAILAVIANLVILDVIGFMDRGKTEAYQTELHNVQTAVKAMLTDSMTGQLDTAQIDISDMDLVTASSGALALSDYLLGLNADGTVKTGCTYSFTTSGTVSQTPP